MYLKQKLIPILSVFAGILLFAGSLNAEKAKEEVKYDSDIDSVVKGNTEFALNLYEKLKSEKGNLFFSPYSISTALAMTYGGARGKTETQMAKTLCFKLDQAQLHPAFGQLELKLKENLDTGSILLNTANSIWPQDKYLFLKNYTNMLEKNYNVTVTPVNYKGNLEKVCKQINTWVEEKTVNKIKDLIQPIHLNKLTRLVLVNAIYFKGNWASQFNKEHTKDAPFWITPEDSIDVPMMFKKGKFGYGEHDSLQILELPYKGREISMFVILPLEKEGLDRLQKNLTVEKLTEWTKHTSTKEVKVYLPKFKVTSQFDLSKTLISMGMVNAFTKNKANFSGMDGKKKWLYISSVIHKAFVDVNEEGTEAAAATAVAMRALSMPEPPPVVLADHPFLFVIRENSKQNILFIGRIVDASIASQ